MNAASGPAPDAGHRPEESAALDAGLREAFGSEVEPASGANARAGELLARLDARGGRAARAGDPAEESRYRLLAEIAHGGIGVVMRGRDLDLERDVAVKLLREDHGENPALLGRFIEEARIGGRLQHPGIVPVYEVGLLARGRPFIAMKLIEGETLAALFARRADPADDRGRFLGILEKVCHTVAYAHSRGIVHRDLKPHNVMVGAFGEVQVVDWGLAKVLPRPSEDAAAGRESPDAAHAESPPSAADSVAGSVMGTPAYMAPEQARGEVASIDERTDVFALGAILCELLVGRPPYDAAHGSALELAQQARLEPVLAAIGASGADGELLDLCGRCLAVDARDRPRDGAAVASRLGAYLAAVEERARAAQLAATEARVKAQEERKARRLTLALTAALLFIVVAGGGGWLAWEQQQRERSAATERDVRTALADATLHRGAARWAEARLAIARAQSRLDAGPAGAELRDDARRLAAVIETEAEATRRRSERERENLALVTQLEQAREPEDRFLEFGNDWPRIDREYAAILRSIGIDVDALPTAAAAAALAERRIPGELSAAVDEWSMSRRFAGDPVGAARLAEVAIALDGDVARARLRRVIERGDAAELQSLAQAPDLEGIPASLLNLLGRALFEAGRLDDSVALYRRAQRRFPADFLLNANLARRLLDLRPRRAIEAAGFLRAALAARPTSVAIRFELADLLRRDLREPEAAAAAMRDALALDRDNVHLMMELGLDLAAARAFAEALEVALENVRSHPTSAVAWEGLAIVRFLRHELEEAITASGEAIRLDPESVEGHHTRASALLASGELEAAIASARSAQSLRPELADVHVVLGVALDQVGSHADAVRALREASRLDPALSDVAGHLAVALTHWVREQLLAGEHAAALKAAREAVDADRGSAAAHVLLAVALDATGNPRDALAAARVAESLSPEGSGCALAQQSFLLNSGADPENAGGEEADRLARAAVERARRRAPQRASDGSREGTLPDDHADHWIVLALAACQLEHWERAREALEAANTLSPANPAVAFLLARTHAELIEEEQARTWFERGVQWAAAAPAASAASCVWLAPSQRAQLRDRLRANAATALGIEGR